MSSSRLGGGDKYGTLRAQQETYLDRINRQILKDADFPFIYVPALAQRLDIYKQKFMDFDSDNSDDIDFGEFKLMLESLGERKSHVQQKRLFAQCAKTRPDKIIYRDFVDVILGDVLGLGIIFEEEQDIVDKAEIQRQKNSVFKLPKREAPPIPVQVTQPEMHDDRDIYENIQASPPSYRSNESVQEETTEDEESEDEEETETEEEEEENPEPKVVERTFTDITRQMERAMAVRSEAPQSQTRERNPPDYLQIFDNQNNTGSAIRRSVPHDVPTSARIHQTQTTPNPPPSVCSVSQLPPAATRTGDSKMSEANLTPQQLTSVPYTYVCTDPNCPDSHPKPAPVAPAAPTTHAQTMCGDPTCTFIHSQVAPVSQTQQAIQPYAQAQYQPVQYTQPASQSYIMQNNYPGTVSQQYTSTATQQYTPTATQQPNILYSSIPLQHTTQQVLSRAGSFGYLPDAAQLETSGDFIIPQNVYISAQNSARQNLAVQNQMTYGNQLQYYETPGGYILQ